MSRYVNGVADLDYLIPEIWSPDFYSELRKNLVIAPLVERKYEGAIKAMGDKVNVQQINAGTAELITSDDKQEFGTSVISTTQKSITVNYRAVSAREITDQAKLQSQDFMNELKAAMAYEVAKKIEDTIIAAISPSASAPDHILTTASSNVFAIADIANMRTLLSAQGCDVMNRVVAADPFAYGSMLQQAGFTSADYIPAGSPASSGAIDNQLFGFKIVESNNISTNYCAYAFHPSFLQLVIQQDPRLQISNLHANRQFGFVISYDVLFGLTQFDSKRVVKYTGS